MSHGFWLQDDVKSLIREIYLSNRHISASKAREELLERMRSDERRLDEKYGSDYPKVGTVSNYLKKLRDRDAARSEESKAIDKPWSVGSLAKHPIPADVLPLVLSVYTRTAIEGDYLTIREALWISRIYKALEVCHRNQLARLADPRKTRDTQLGIQLGDIPENYQEVQFEELLLDYAYQYAQHELESELEGEEFVSPGELDLHLQVNAFEYYGERRIDAEYAREVDNEQH